MVSMILDQLKVDASILLSDIFIDHNWLNGVPLQDDITIVVVKKT